ncbi:MAG: AAA family ATPase [Bacteroidota bacterium]
MVLAVSHPFGKNNKSKTSLHLTKKFASLGERVLLIDLTCDSFTTNVLGIGKREKSMIDVMDGNYDLNDVIIGVGDFAFAPASYTLKLIDIALAWSDNRNTHLENALNQLEIEFDHIIIDCDSSLSFLTINALTACDALILPAFSDQKPKDPDSTIHLFGCEELMDQKAKRLTNHLDIFDQLLHNVDIGNKVLMLEQPIWTSEYLSPQLAAITQRGYQFAATEKIETFKVFLN